ncbi:MAG: hypothetical protein CMQ84_08570 [Gammaproteobacteria bacterium]|nr:hypothetical protein [Gammaproteobacteria bacterium]OUX76263.1 MAG: hypothetical protein CBC19_09750 [Oceanospirillales bacterium TMED59]
MGRNAPHLTDTRMRRYSFFPAEYLASALIIALGIFYFFGSYEYEMGTARHMGPGFLPRAYAVCAVALGALIFIGAIRRETVERSSVDYRFVRSFFGIMAAIIAFAVVIPQFGLIPASVLSVLLASLGSEYFKPATAIWMAMVISLATWLVFSVMLGLPIPGVKGL